MNGTWDLAAILVLLSFITGIIWLYDKVFLESKRKKTIEKAKLSISKVDLEKIATENTPVLVDLARSLFPVFIIVLGLRSFIVEPFRIPSGSMMPTLLIGDFILVNKFYYGIRLPVLNSKVIEINKPERGDVVVFRYPGPNGDNLHISPIGDTTPVNTPFIKRIIGLPGDIVEYNYNSKVIYINGEPMTQTMEQHRYVGVGGGSNMTGSEQRIEHLAEDLDHNILVITEEKLSYDPIDKWVVPADKYFVFGDNRDNSKDSRVWGYVPEANLIGKAFFIWMNWDWKNGGISWQRIGTTIE
ncbi:MAG: signal peptidase I [Thiomargarita sp.]|nr:signal peptidase I [Thiomargarita sp.]